jgi:hypothetical protein
MTSFCWSGFAAEIKDGDSATMPAAPVIPVLRKPLLLILFIKKYVIKFMFFP